MGCNTSKTKSEVLQLSSDEPSKDMDTLENGNTGTQNGVNNTLHDMAHLDFQNAQRDLQQVGDGLTAAVNEDMDELLKQGEVKTETEIIEELLTPSPALQEAEAEVEENANTPVPAILDTVKKNETETGEVALFPEEVGKVVSTEKKDDVIPTTGDSDGNAAMSPTPA